jgi:hypothetical protein
MPSRQLTLSYRQGSWRPLFLCFRLQRQLSNSFNAARSQRVAVPWLSVQNHFEDGIICL